MTLIERIEAAEVGSAELDLEVAQALSEPWSYMGEPPKVIRCRPYTTSIDAAVALAERVLPGCRVMVERDNDGTGWVMVEAKTMAGKVMADASTPALALVAAVLRAKEGEG